LGALAEMAGVTKQAISQQVAHLEARGYVVVEPDPADSRAKAVRLTERGRQSQQLGRPLFGELEEDWQRRFGATDVRELRRILEAILEQMDDTAVLPRRRGGGQGPAP
jgi:DNA-binding MarR family transcriptional regulator